MDEKIKAFFLSVSKLTLAVVFAALIIILLVIGIFVWLNHDNRAGFDNDTTIGITPTVIASIKDIGQWEFLSVSDEELIDTVHHGFFGDDALVRIYYGTLHLGIDMGDVRPGWMHMDHDTVVVTLPPVKLLDHDFIDEGLTRSFFESGSWSDSDRAALYKRAYFAMINRCMTPSNIKSAEQNGSTLFDNLLRTMGYDHVRVHFTPTQ